jgi:hypothetical protein
MSIELASNEEQQQGAVILRNVAELAQRQQARELGASLSLQVFRLLKIVGFHALDNMTVIQQLDQTIEALKAFGVATGEALTMLFAKGTVFVAGHLLKASRGEYEAALELGEMVRRLGVSEITIQTEANRTDLTALCRLFAPQARIPQHDGLLEPSPNIRLRYVNPARLGDDEEALSYEEQVVRTYATAVVVMRRVYENLMSGRYQLPHQAKRLAQRLVMLSEGDTPAFLGITAMRNLNHDAAGRAVNRAILAVSVARQLTGDLAVLARVAMSALFFDVAHPLVTGIVGRGNEVVVAHMTEDAERRLPAATALVLTALGQLRHASMVRTVITYEAHWLDQSDVLGQMYSGARRPMVAPRLVQVSNRFNQLLEPDLAASSAPTPDDAVSKMRLEARDATDRAMLALLIGALGMFPRGTPVELSSGERGVVLKTPEHPAAYTNPTVRLVYDAQGQPLRSHIAIDLALDPGRTVVGVIANPEGLLAEAVQAVLARARASVAPKARSEPPEPDFENDPSFQAQTSTPAPVSAPALTPAPASASQHTPAPSSAPAGTPQPISLRDITPAPVSVREQTPAPASIRERTPPPLPSRRERTPASMRARVSPSSISDLDPHSSPTVIASAVEVARRPGAKRAPSLPPESHRVAVTESHSVAVPMGDGPEFAPIIEKNSAATVEKVVGPSVGPARRPAPRRVQPPIAGGEFEGVVPEASEISEVEPSAPSSHWRRAPRTIPPSERPAVPAGFEGSHAPSASGSFDRTPFSHILLYILDRTLSGTLIFTEPADREEDAPVEHAGYFRDGIPTKVNTGVRVAPLGSLLVAYGVLDQAQLESEPISQPPTHEASLEAELLEFGLARPDQIAEVRNEQLTERLAYLFSLPRGTKYSFYNGLDLLEGIWGNVPGAVSPLGTLTRGLRVHPEEAAMDRVLTRVGGFALQLHPDADLDSFEFDESERAVAEMIRAKMSPLPDLVEAGHDPDVIRRVVYQLMITRCITPAPPPSQRSGIELKGSNAPPVVPNSRKA